MKRKLEEQKEKIIANESAFAEKIKGKEDTTLIEYKVMLAEMRSAFENLTLSKEHLVSDARYYSVMILHNYSLFSAKYFG